MGTRHTENAHLFRQCQGCGAPTRGRVTNEATGTKRALCTSCYIKSELFRRPKVKHRMDPITWLVVLFMIALNIFLIVFFLGGFGK